MKLQPSGPKQAIHFLVVKIAQKLFVSQRFLLENQNDDKEKNIELLLRSADWFPGRSIDIGLYADACKSDGYEVNIAATEFMTRYGGLTVTHPSYAGDEDDYSILDPKKAIDTVFFERTESYRKRSIENEKLCPVGVGFSEHLVYFVGESGKFYGGFDDYFCLIGTDYFDAFDNIFNRHFFAELCMP